LILQKAGFCHFSKLKQVGEIEGKCLMVNRLKMRKAGFEPARLSPPPPQDGVSTSSTTSAFDILASKEDIFLFLLVNLAIFRKPTQDRYSPSPVGGV
jgi:hypothetical protein